MADDLKRLRASRNAYRSHLTKLSQKVDELLDSSEALNDSQIAALCTSLEKLSRKGETLRELDIKITQAIEDPDEVETEVYEAEEIQDTILERTDQIKRFLKHSEVTAKVTTEPHPLSGNSLPSSSFSATATTFIPLTQPPQDTLPSSSSHGSVTSQSSHSVSRLPKLSLPTFSGDPLSWQTFWDCFSAAVDSSPVLSGVQKFNYLRAQLQGEAARAVAGFPLTEGNYTHSVDILKERFGQNQTIVNAHMQALMNLPPPKNTVTELRAFYDSIEGHIRSLLSLGTTTESYGAMLIPVTLGKLPAEVRRNLAREQNRSEWTVKNLREALLKEIRILEQGVFTPSSGTHLLTDGSQSSPRMTTFSLYTGAKGDQTRFDRGKSVKKFTCVYCKGTHSSNNCDVVISAEKRLEQIKKEGLCFNCLGKHRVSHCTSQARCKKCNSKHHTSICNTDSTKLKQTVAKLPSDHKTRPSEPIPSQVTQTATVPVSATIAMASSETSVLCNSGNSVCLLKTAVAKVVSNSGSDTANILFDEGAQRSFISKRLANTLQLTPRRQEHVSLASFGADTSTPQHLDVTDVKIVSQTGEMIPLSVLVVSKIAAPFQCVTTSKLRELPYLRDLTLAHPIMKANSQFDISLLIGVDYYWKIVEDHIVRGDGPTAVQSKLGYLLSGPLAIQSSSDTITNMHIGIHDDLENTDQTLEKFWAIESSGTLPAVKGSDPFMDTYLKTISRDEDGSYVVKFPWKEDHAPLPSNYEVCKRRTRSLVRRLVSTPELMNTYDKIIKEQEKRGFVEKVSLTSQGPAHYIPHHHVKKDSVTTPIRVVYDCSCQMSNNHPSLNDCLEVGPSLVNDLCSILLRFRVHKFGLTTDIEKAFLHVKLHEDDRDFTRFFWLSNPEDPESEFDVYRFKAVLFGSTSSPFMLNATLHLHLSKQNSETANDMIQNLYVDNVISGGPNEESVVQYFRMARSCMSEANFNLRSWASNSPQLQAITHEESVADPSQMVNLLGLHWNVSTDQVCFVPKQLTSDTDIAVTKRNVLQLSSRIFDPLGFLSPVSVRAKLLMQQLWQMNVGWDEPLEPSIREQWNDIADNLQKAVHGSISRRYFTVDNDDCKTQTQEIHGFADASLKAYGAVIYIQQANEVSFVIAKTRVAPLSKLTLPKLELMAALVAARLTKFVTESLDSLYPNMAVHLWSDSQIVLHWIGSQKKQKLQFVSHRIQEITQTFPSTVWSYCPTGENPADLLTRGMNHDVLNDPLWMKGPSWITEKSKWPQWKQTEVLHLQTEFTDVREVTMSTEETPYGLLKVLEISNFSSLTRLLRITAYILRFINNTKKSNTRLTGVLSSHEINNALAKWVYSCQQSCFYQEVKHLQSNSRKKLSLVRQLRLFLDKDGFIRCGGRIHNAPLCELSRFPYLLPTKHPLTKLIIIMTHVNQLHSGVSNVISALRQRYWIPRIRQTVRNLLRKCVICRKVSGRPYSIPETPPLPKSRTLCAAPFHVTGVDFTGGLFVRGLGGEEKVYICLFTCASTRAVHLEVVTDLSEEKFLQAFRRFVGRKSLPKLMISDNASTFQSAAREIEKMINSPTLNEHLNKRGTMWQFIPKRAPWYGGFYERLIGLTKTTLKKVLGRTFISLIALQTIVVEIEAILNDRPITYTSTDLNDPEPLCPSHLLYGRRIVTLPYPQVNTEDITDPDYTTASAPIIREAFTHQAHIIQHFQGRWKQEYLTALREFYKVRGTCAPQTIKVGDVVLIHDDLPRGSWKMAVIKRLIDGHDGYVRAAEVRTKNGQTNRPISKLYPLEISTDENDTVTELENSDDKHLPPVMTQRPTRSSAVKAKENITEWSKEILGPAPEDVENCDV